MRAIVLCAGRGERLRPLSDTTPKPLIKVGDEPLLGRHLSRLAAAGFSHVVVNVSHLAEQIADFVGDGSDWNLRVQLSHEGSTALETGGGMLHALNLLGPRPFLAVNGDIWTDLDFSSLPDGIVGHAHLVLVNNPPHNQKGDFGIKQGIVLNQPPTLTYSGIGIYHPELVASQQAGKFSVVPLLREAIEAGQVSGQQFQGQWFDIGSPERLEHARLVVQKRVQRPD